ncbi:MAG: hypothetical protein KAJ46_00425 [Sedimentisphaerales bacterium]|nr:hypothetical protein [Sedimentisphaerales bacterium]
MLCKICGSPERKMWPPSSRTPSFDTIKKGNWITLVECLECKSLWVGVPYEPYAVFVYFVRWEKTVADWQELHDADDGEQISEWHTKQLLALEPTLSEEDKKAVEWHRQRSYGRTPFD